MPTREVYQVNQSTGKSTYSGYARFGADGSFRGTAGGYGRNRNSNSATRNVSRVQNTISTVSARQARRRPSVL